MAYGTVNADVIGTSVTGSNLGAGNASIMKNRIINGAMVIDQRNAGASTTVTNTSGTTQYYTCDRFGLISTAASKMTIQQNAGSVTPPVGFTNYLGITSLSAFNPVPGTDYFTLGQKIEGFNTADLNWGTANAKTITLSFWVYSSLTGTFGGALQNSAQTRSYPFSYTINSANTWEQKSITIAGDTSGTWIGATNGIGISVLWGISIGYSAVIGPPNAWASADYRTCTGATNILGTNGATWYITGVQLEVGSSATGFEYRNYQQELALCQRYYEYSSVYTIWSGYVTSGNACFQNSPYKVTKRATATPVPTFVAAVNFGSTVLLNSQGAEAFQAYMVGTASGHGYYQYTWTASAEL